MDFHTADIHFWHSKCIAFDKRTPFMSPDELEIINKIEERPEGGFSLDVLRDIKISDESVQRMNNTIVENINQKVKKGDRLFFLGDLGWDYEQHYKWYVKTLRDDIVCNNIHFIWGNHDCKRKGDRGPLPVLKAILEEANVTDLGMLRTIRSEGQTMVLCHYAMGAWDRSHYGSINVHGHSHHRYENTLPNQIDVGINGHDYFPISTLDIKNYIKNKKDKNETTQTA